MKTFLMLVVLFFSPSVFAENISDFQIEGMSIGDSLLDYYSEEDINKNLHNYFANDHTYAGVEFYKLESFKIYHGLVIDFKRQDKNFVIESISGTIFTKNMNDCKKLQKNIDNELSLMLNNTNREENNNDHEFDKTGESKTTAINYWFNNDDLITIICTDWSDSITNKFGWTDNLSLELKTNEYNNKLY